MSQKFRLFGLILVVPLIGFLVASGIDTRTNSQLRRAVRAQTPQAPPSVVAQLTVAVLCERPDVLNPDLCKFNRHVRFLGAFSAFVALTGLGLVGLIWVAGAAARRSRLLLLRVFKPGLYVTASVLIVLVLGHAAIAIAVLYYGESFLFEAIHPAFLLGIAVGALSGSVAIATNTFRVVRSATARVLGRPIGHADATGLWAGVEATASRLDALAPEHIVLGLDPTFFVTETDVECLDGALRGRTLYCSVPLMRILTVDEFFGIVGHELAHFKGLDTKFSQQFFPIYRGTVDSLFALGHAANAGVTHMLALLPAFALFGHFLECFGRAERQWSRERELNADAAGAGLVSTAVMGSALVKVHAFAGLLDEVHVSAVALLRQRRSLVNVGRTFARLVASRAAPSLLDNLAERHVSHPTDTHPTLTDRLTALGESVHAVRASALAVSPHPSAVMLVNDPEALEREVSDAYKRRLLDHPEILALDSDIATVAVDDADVEVVSEVLCRFCKRPLPAPRDERQETVACETCGTRQAVERAGAAR